MTALVGRSAELGALVAAVQNAQSGTASVVVLDGDAGVGKTRVLAELIAQARTRGALPLIGHCVDLGDAPPPYMAFTEAFARLAAQQPDVVAGLRSSFPALGRLLPRGGEDPYPAGERVDRGELFEAVLNAIGALATQQPVLFIVEDLHWADQATRDLLGFMFTRLREEPVSVIVSYRSDDLYRRHPLRPTLAQWSRLPNVERVHLDPLTSDDVRSLVRAIHAGPIPEAEIGSIVTRADGNAFFAEELVAASDQYSDAGQLPWQLADVLLVRLDRLGDDAREVVRVAAVGGRRVGHELLTEVVDLSPPALEAALREAVDAHILEPTASGRGYTFRHALLGEAVYDDLLPGERVRFHAGYARAIADGPGRHTAELARHAKASHDLPTAYTASLRAGEEAMSMAAPQEALQHFETALEIGPQLAAPPDDPAPLMLALVDAAVAAGGSFRALRIARATLAALPDDASDSTRARLLYAVAFAGVVGEVDVAMVHGTAEALRMTPADPPSRFRAHLAALHARLNLITGREVDAERWAQEAVALAVALGRPGASADAETTLAMLARRADHPEEVADRLRAVAEEAQQTGETAAELRSRYNLGSLYWEHGALAESQQAYELVWRRARELGRPWAAFGLDARGMTGLVQYTRGDWDGALRTLDISGESPTALAEALYASAVIEIRVGRGDSAAEVAFGDLRPWWEREGRIALNSVVAALELYEQDARVDAALALLDNGVELLSKLWQDTWFLARIRLSSLAVAVVAAAIAGTPDSARAALVERARPLVEDGRTSAEKGVPQGRRLGLEAVAWQARLEAEWARLRWLAGVQAPDVDEHIDVWQAAVDGFGFGNVVEQARSRARLAAVLRAAGRGPEAAEQARLAREVARRLRATPLLEEIRALGLSSSVRQGTGVPSALTDREREVLALLVDGRTNRQIAQRLYISEKTVSVHVSNILAKLKVRSRNEAAALARRDGLLA
ncbi:MAG: AAA family ATPase [Jatrophihabitantaceae bacterium]